MYPQACRTRKPACAGNGCAIFPIFKPQHGSKRSAARPRTILFRVSLERAYRKTAVVRTDSVSRTVAVFVISYQNIKTSEGPCAERH